MSTPDLPIHSALFSENRRDGLLLCGINHGWSKQDERDDAAGVDRFDKKKSFFSDGAVNDYRFRNRVATWLGMWGLSLERQNGKEGPLERSIVQTNWLQTCTRDAKSFSVRQACIDDATSFLLTCDQLRPSAVLFFGRELMWAFSSGPLRPRVEAIFGSAQGPLERIDRPVVGSKQFQMTRLRLERATVMAVPHATGAIGLTDAYIRAQTEVAGELQSWWHAHQGRLGLLASKAA